MKTWNEFKKEQDGIKLVLIQGSPRYDDCCPGETSKTAKIINKVIKELPDYIETTVIDLAVKCDGLTIQPCKGCVGTASGYHCHWPCDCYEPNSKDLPDFMHDNKVYDKLEKSDGFVVFSPIHWDQTSTQVKAMFDRLVCASMSLPAAVANQIFDGDVKNPAKTRAASKSGEHVSLLKNHLEGKYAGFFVQGNDGGNDYKEFVKGPGNKSLPVLPPAYMENKPKQRDEKEIIRQAVDGIIRQCLYSGIYVKDDCVDGVIVGKGQDYTSINDKLAREYFKRAKQVVLNVAKHIRHTPS